MSWTAAKLAPVGHLKVIAAPDGSVHLKQLQEALAVRSWEMGCLLGRLERGLPWGPHQP